MINKNKILIKNIKITYTISYKYTYEFDEITSNFVSKSSPNQLNQEEFEEAQQLLQMSKTKYENLISENLELKLKIDNKVLEKESNKTDDMIECEICQTSIKKSNKTRHQKTKKCMEAKK